MSNRRMNLSGTGKEILDRLCANLEVARPQGIKISLAKGIASANGNAEMAKPNDSRSKWTIPDNIIRDKEYLLFKQLIINEIKHAVTDEQVNQAMLNYIEYGLRIISDEMNELTSMEDYRISILK